MQIDLWNIFIFLLFWIVTSLLPEGFAIFAIVGNTNSLPYVETLGCWKSKLNFTETDLSNLILGNNSVILQRDRNLHLVEECAKWTQGLGYSVFFVNFLDKMQSPCLTGAHATHLYTNYESSMIRNCDSLASSTERTYVYSVIGTLSSQLFNEEPDSKRFSIYRKQDTQKISPQESLIGQKKSQIREQPTSGQFAAQNQLAPNFDVKDPLVNRVQSPVINNQDYRKIAKQLDAIAKSESATTGSSDTSTKPNEDNNESVQNITMQDLVEPWLKSMDTPDKKGKEIDELTFFNDIPSGHIVTENILRNPSFEDTLVLNSLSGWICQGESNEPKSGIISQYSSDHHGEGQFSGRCSERVANWAGPGQYIGNVIYLEMWKTKQTPDLSKTKDKYGRYLKHGTNYKFSTWVRLETKQYKNIKDKKLIEVWLRYRDRESSRLHAKMLAKYYLLANDPTWENIISDFHVPKIMKKVSFVFLYMKGPSRDIDILIDDSKLVPVPSVDNWRKASDAAIEKIRKRTVRIRLILPKSMYNTSDVVATRIEVKQRKHLFGFGAAVSGSILSNKEYQEFFVDNFEWAVLENAHKWTKTEPEKGYLTYETADKMVNFLLNNNKTIRGHCIFWDVPESQPKWLNQLHPREFREALEKRLENIVLRYKGTLNHWDVNNEMLHGNFYTKTLKDPSIRQWMHHRVKELDPDVKLFLNDFDVVENSLLTKAYVDLANDLLKQNVPIDGIGAQGHFTGVVNPVLLKDRLNLLMETNLPIWLTEVDIVEPDPHKRAISLENVMRVGFSHPGVHGIMLWCFWNKSCWRGEATGLVEEDNFKLTEAGRVYQDLRRQWTTTEELKTSNVIENEGHFVFRGFHGDYDVYIHLPDGQSIAKEMTIKPGHSDLPLKIRVYEKICSPKETIQPGSEYQT